MAQCLNTMSDGFFLNSINIQLDSSVKSITRVAAMCLSGSIENGIVITQNENPNITIYKNRIEFGKCYNPMLQGYSGCIYPYIPNFGPNFYIEYGNLIYYYDSAYKCSFWSKELDYQGIFAPSVPDNVEIFNMIYPKFS